MGAKRKARQRQQEQFSNVVDINYYNKKNHVEINPRNEHQESYMHNLLDRKKDIVFGIGPAGTGKTMIAVQVAVKMFKNGQVDKIVVTRPAVSADEDLGFLPGTLEQKMAPWTRPIFDTLREYFSAKDLEGMINEGVLEIAPLAFMRGRTFKNAFIIADEMQLSTPNQMKMLLTRTGEKSYMAITGDLDQADRGENNGLLEFLNKSKDHNSERIATVYFNKTDIERHPVVEEVLGLYGDS